MKIRNIFGKVFVILHTIDLRDDVQCPVCGGLSESFGVKCRALTCLAPKPAFLPPAIRCKEAFSISEKVY